MNDLVLTLDMDWAPDCAIDFVSEELVSREVRATWFVTHASPAVHRLREHPELFELGIHPNNLYKWRAQFAEDGEEAFPGKGKQSGIEEELRQLRRENMRLREERDILKKAVIFFSNESE